MFSRVIVIQHEINYVMPVHLTKLVLLLRHRMAHEIISTDHRILSPTDVLSLLQPAASIPRQTPAWHGSCNTDPNLRVQTPTTACHSTRPSFNLRSSQHPIVDRRPAPSPACHRRPPTPVNPTPCHRRSLSSPPSDNKHPGKRCSPHQATLEADRRDC